MSAVTWPSGVSAPSTVAAASAAGSGAQRARSPPDAPRPCRRRPRRRSPSRPGRSTTPGQDRRVGLVAEHHQHHRRRGIASSGEVSSSAPARLCRTDVGLRAGPVARRRRRGRPAGRSGRTSRRPRSARRRRAASPSWLPRRVDQGLLGRVGEGRAARRTCRRRCRRPRSTCAASALTASASAPGHRDERDGRARAARPPYSAAALAAANSSPNVAPRLAPARSVRGGRGGGLVVAAQVAERAAAEGDADGEREEDGDERDDVVAVRDHEKSPCDGRTGRSQADSVGGPLLADGGDGDGGGQGDQAGEHHQQQVPRPHPAGVQVRDARRRRPAGARP